MRNLGWLSFMILAFILIGCSCEKAFKEDVKFWVLDMRNADAGGISAVRFCPKTSSGMLPCATYVGCDFTNVLHDVYVNQHSMFRNLGDFYCVEQAAAKFSELENLCRENSRECDSAVVVTFYSERACPRTYFMPVEQCCKVLSSWSFAYMTASEVIARRGEYSPGEVEVLSVDFESVKNIVMSERYEMVVALPNDSASSVVDVYGGGRNLRPSSFFRGVGTFFPRHYSPECFVSHLKGHLKEWHGSCSSVRIVLW